MPDHPNRRRPALLERVLIAAALLVTGWAAAQMYYANRFRDITWFGIEGRAELAPVAGKYGPSHYSRNVEEWLIRDYFGDQRGGVFLDVGANDYRQENNTYYLERELGWSGIAIDALPEFAEGYRQNRPRTRFLALFASDVTGTKVQLFVPDENKLVASASRDFTVKQGTPGSAREVPTTTLNDVLTQAGIERINFMSMDIELSEPKALSGFDIQRYRPSLVCIEAHPEVRQQILDYFVRNQYTVVGKYLRADPKNLYFAPLAR